MRPSLGRLTICAVIDTAHSKAVADHPREETAWSRRDLEQDAAHWLDEVRNAHGDDGARLTAELAEVATKVAWARSKMTEGEWREFEGHQRLRLAEVERIIAEEPRESWRAKLVQFDRRTGPAPALSRDRFLKLALRAVRATPAP